MGVIMKKKRRELTVDDVLKNDKYMNILFLLRLPTQLERKMKLYHLKYYLVENHNIDKKLHKKIEQIYTPPEKTIKIIDQNIEQMKKEYRIVWEREGIRRKTKRYRSLKMLKRYVRLLKNDRPWEIFNLDKDDNYCCGGHECGCQGETVEEHFQNRYVEIPDLEYLYLESREIGEWIREDVP